MQQPHAACCVKVRMGRLSVRGFESNLLGFPELLDDLCSHLVVFQKVICDGVADPGGPLRWTQLQQLVPCLLQKTTDRRGFIEQCLTSLKSPLMITFYVFVES